MTGVTSGNVNGEHFNPRPHATPQTRPEHLASDALAHAEASSHYRPGDKMIVLVMGESVPAALRAGPGRRQPGVPAGMMFLGYSSMNEVIRDLLTHLQGIGLAAGMDIAPVWMDGS